MPSTYAQTLTAIRAKKWAPVYFLQGTNTYQIDALVQQIEAHALPPAAKSFNLTKGYGKDLTLNQLLLQARRIPLNAPLQVIIVKEAQTLPGLLNKSQYTALLHYLKQPVETTILVFAYKNKTLSASSPLAKALTAKGMLVTTKALYDRQLPAWLISYLKAKGRTITEKAMLLLQLYMGNNQQLLANTLDKLLLRIPTDGEIRAKDVQAHTGIHRDYDLYALQRALGKRDIGKISHMLAYFAGNPKAAPLPLVLTLLHQFYTKLLIVHQLGAKAAKSQLAQALGIRPFWVEEYRTAAKTYPKEKIVSNVALLHEVDRQFKGIVPLPMPEVTRLQYLVQRLL